LKKWPIEKLKHMFLSKYGSDKNKTMTYDIGNLGPGLEQAHKCGSVKPVNGIPNPTHPSNN